MNMQKLLSIIFFILLFNLWAVSAFAATKENIMMVEGEMKEISEEEMVEAIKFAHDAIKVTW